MLTHTLSPGTSRSTPAAHLLGRFVGESERKNVLCGGTVRKEPGNPVSDHSRLAAAGTGKNEQRTVNMADGLALRRIQSFEEMFNQDRNPLHQPAGEDAKRPHWRSV